MTGSKRGCRGDQIREDLAIHHTVQPGGGGGRRRGQIQLGRGHRRRAVGGARPGGLPEQEEEGQAQAQEVVQEQGVQLLLRQAQRRELLRVEPDHDKQGPRRAGGVRHGMFMVNHTTVISGFLYCVPL
jgi:hypothetical protein